MPSYGIILIVVILCVLYITLFHKSADYRNNGFQSLKQHTGEFIRMTIPKDKKKPNIETVHDKTLDVINTEGSFLKEE